MRLPNAHALLVISALTGLPAASAAQDVGALARAGTAAIESRRFGDALHAFTRASAIRPDDASLCFGAGVAAFMLGRNALAQSRFECALAANPNHRSSLVWLGDLHYRAGRVEAAISLYEAAQQRWPDDPELWEQLDAWRREHELERRFRVVRSEHFTVRFEQASDQAVAHRIVERLEAARSRIGSSLGAYPADAIGVLLYSPEQFLAVTRVAMWSVAAFDGRIRLPLGRALDDAGELDRVLSHELVHAIVANVGGRNVPSWLNEGLATVFEPAGSADVEALLSDAPTKLRDGFTGLSRPDADVAYASAARAVRMLIDRRGAAAILGLLEDLGNGASFPRAFEQRMGMKYEDLETLVSRRDLPVR